MEDNNRFTVNGYRFGTAQDAEKARMELKQIDYFEQRLEGRALQSVLSIYDKILDEKMFVTPVGWEYLCRLQIKLKESGVPEEFIRPIPMYVTFNHETADEGGMPVRQRIRPSRKMSADQKRARTSIIINIFLAVLVMAMFLIALHSDHPNILNYKKVILNQYSSWEQELTEREREVKEKEAALMDRMEEN